MSAPPGNDPPNPNSRFFHVLLLFVCTNLPGFFTLADDVPVDPNLEDYVYTPEFDNQCSKKAREHALSSDKSSDSDSDDSDSSPTTAESAPYEVSKVEGHLYYAGVSPRGRGPKLIYRTSSDIFEEPSGPEAYRRLMKVIAVPDDHEFGKDGMWGRVRDKVPGLLVTQQFLD